LLQFTKRPSTDTVNTEHFEKLSEGTEESHQGTLPVASYRLATDKAFDGEQNRGAYSFCMCPGGQIVPSSTEEGELCINGMSFSNRDSLWANSALVVTVSQDDPILDKYRSHGCLAGLEFQRDIERKAYELGGMNMTVPVSHLLLDIHFNACNIGLFLLTQIFSVGTTIDRLCKWCGVFVYSSVILSTWSYLGTFT